MTTEGRDDAALVASGYDLVHSAFMRSPALRRLWRVNAAGADYPEAFDHLSFLSLADAQRMRDELRVGPDETLVDLACGAGGPGLWMTSETKARLLGLDVSAAAIDVATERAAALGLADRVSYGVGSFAETGLETGRANAVMSVDALQYAPDKRAALEEIARTLKPGGRLVFTNFELDTSVVAGLPVYGMDPVGDYTPLLEASGFDVEAYEETPGWGDRVTAACEAVLASADELIGEMGEAAYELMASDLSFTLNGKPYSSRKLAVATRPA